jgi:hypothetical protein
VHLQKFFDSLNATGIFLSDLQELSPFTDWCAQQLRHDTWRTRIGTGQNGQPVVLPYSSAGLAAALERSYNRLEGGLPAVSWLQLAFVCLRIRRRLETPVQNADRGTNLHLLMDEELRLIEEASPEDGGVVGVMVLLGV